MGNSKTDARERAVMLLFEADSKAVDVAAVTSALDVEPDKYTVALLEDYATHCDRINELMTSNSRGWSSDRMPGLDRAILRMAITELVRNADTPVGTVISEAVVLCDKYSTDESGRFVNGVLGTIAHQVRGVDLLRKDTTDTADVEKDM